MTAYDTDWNQMSNKTLPASSAENAEQSPLLTIERVAARTGLSVGRIRNLRTNAEIAKNGHHPLYSLGFKVGFGVNSRLLWRESDVDAFLATRRQDALGGAA